MSASRCPPPGPTSSALQGRAKIKAGSAAAPASAAPKPAHCQAKTPAPTPASVAEVCSTVVAAASARKRTRRWRCQRPWSVAAAAPPSKWAKRTRHAGSNAPSFPPVPCHFPQHRHCCRCHGPAQLGIQSRSRHRTWSSCAGGRSVRIGRQSGHIPATNLPSFLKTRWPYPRGVDVTCNARVESSVRGGCASAGSSRQLSVRCLLVARRGHHGGIARMRHRRRGQNHSPCLRRSSPSGLRCAGVCVCLWLDGSMVGG